MYAALLVPAVTFGLPLLGLRRAGPKVRCVTWAAAVCCRPWCCKEAVSWGTQASQKSFALHACTAQWPWRSLRLQTTSHSSFPCMQAGESSQSTGSAPLSSKKKKGKAGKH